MFKSFTIAATIFGIACIVSAPAHALQSVECHSQDYNYNECFVGNSRGWSRPVIREQLSSSRCEWGRSWGYDQRKAAIWVDHGCSAIFVDGSNYRDRGGDDDSYRRNYHDDLRSGDTTPPPEFDRSGNRNYNRQGEYTGCHGAGCLVDNPDQGNSTNPNNWVLCDDGAYHPDCSYAPDGH